jgi:hypothetical protein
VGSRESDGSYGEVRLWDVELGRVQAVLEGEVGKIRSLALAPDGRASVTGSRLVVVLWDVAPITTRGAEARAAVADRF